MTAPLLLIKPTEAKASSLPAYRYTKTFNNANGSSNINSIATDSQGNVYVAGEFLGTVTFGGSDTYTDAGGHGDAFVTKYSSNGTYLWTKAFDSTHSIGQGVYANGVAVNSLGNIYITGIFYGSVNFAGNSGTDNQTDAGGHGDAFLTEYNTSGAYGWTKTFNSTNSGSNGVYAGSVATDASGNVYITGNFDGTINFNPTGSGGSQTSSNPNSFLVEYSSSGTYDFTKTFDTSGGNSFSQSVAIDSSGNIYITGYFADTVIFDGSGGHDSQSAGGNSGADDTFITKYASSGTYAWTKTFDITNGWTNGWGIATDSQGNIYATGEFGGTVIFDGSGGHDSQTAAGSSYDTYLTKINSNGSYAWTKSFNTSASGADSYGISVATNSQGDVYVNGVFQGTVNFAGTSGTDNQTAGASHQNYYVTEYTTSGNYAWTRSLDTTNGTTDGWSGGAVATDSLGNIYFAGDFTGTVVFDGVGGSDSRTSTAANGDIDDAFLTSYSVTPTSLATGTSITTTQAPDTGFGTPKNGESFNLLTITTLVVALFIMGYAYYRYGKIR